MKKVVCAVLTVLIATTLMFGADAHKKPPVKPSLPLSPLFARLAFNLKQEIDDLRRESTTPLVDGDSDTEPYSIHEKAISDAMDRVETFDLRTAGDRKVFEMLKCAIAFSGHEALMLKVNIETTPRASHCLQEIDDAIQARRYTGDGRCDYGKSVVAEMDANEKAMQAKQDEEWQQTLKGVDDTLKQIQLGHQKTNEAIERLQQQHAY